jgi:hypothetical protein
LILQLFFSLKKHEENERQHTGREMIFSNHISNKILQSRKLKELINYKCKYKKGAAIQKTMWWFLKKVNKQITYDTALELLMHLSQKNDKLC